MHSRSECSSRIDMHDHLAFIFRLYFFPGRNDQDIIHIELVKIFFPVIDPVHILCLGFFYRSFTYFHIGTHIFQFIFHSFQKTFFIFIFFQIETDICDAVIDSCLRKDINKHLLFFRLCHRNLILNLDSLYTKVHQHTTDNVFCLGCCL